MSNSDILKYFGKTHASYLHANGKKATNILIQLLDCSAGEKVLEFGCGTGATLTDLAAMYKHSVFYGVDNSSLMLSKTKSRLRLCKLEDKVQLYLVEENNSLSFIEHTFDKVYVESVLAIQEGESIPKILSELYRVLKPGGLLIVNETLWLDSVSAEQMQMINTECKKAFGIIQSSDAFPHIKDWREILEQANFTIENIVHLDTYPDIASSHYSSIHSFLSLIFTAAGKLKRIFNYKLHREKKIMAQHMKTIIPLGSKLMEGVIICLRKGRKADPKVRR